MATQTVLATYDYEESESYEGPALKGIITFRGLKGTQLAVKWLLEDLIRAKCAIANVTPLHAILKVSQIQEEYLDYITDEYELILYYHESPVVISVIYAIAVAIAAVGFLIIAYKATETTWESVANLPSTIAALPESLSKAAVNIAGVGIAAVFIYFLYKYYS